MSMESDLQLALEACCPNVYPVTADPMPAGAFITWQLFGGQPWRYVDNAAAGQRHTFVQINTWAPTLAEALQLIRQVEQALCAAAPFIASPLGEPQDSSEPVLKRWGLIQDFSIVANR